MHPLPQHFALALLLLQQPALQLQLHDLASQRVYLRAAALLLSDKLISDAEDFRFFAS